MLFADALRTWVVPTVAAVVSLVVFIVHSIGVIDEAAAVTVIGSMAFAVVLFYGLRGFTEHPIGGGLAALLAAFTVVWLGAIFVPFYHLMNPGTPVFQGKLGKASPLAVPMANGPGNYVLAVEGHFVGAAGHVNRSGAYQIALAQAEKVQRLFEGTFSQDWRQQRVGAGRRSIAVPVLHEVNMVRDAFDVVTPGDLSLTLKDLSADVQEPLGVRIYAETVPAWAWTVLGVLAVVLAVVVDATRRPGEHEGVTGALTVAALVGLLVFRRSTSRIPGLPQLAVSALAGGIVGAAAGFVLARLLDPLRRLLPQQQA